MRSIVCKAPTQIEMVLQKNIDEIKDDEVMIKVKRIGICGTDIHAFKGEQPFLTYPRILGHELSVIVKVKGNHVKHMNVGDVVTVIPYNHSGMCVACKNGQTNCCTKMQVFGVHQDGGMTEYIKVPASNVLAVNDLSLDEAAIIEPLSVGAHAVSRSSVQKGETALIIGAGPIGLGVARFAKIAGAQTIIMDLSEERLKFGKSWAGSDFAIQANEVTAQKLLEINDGELPSVVFDATGNKESMMNSFKYASHGGSLIYVVLVNDTISFCHPDFHAKELSLLASRNALKEDFEYVIQCFRKGLLNKSYITNKVSFDEACSFFEKGEFHSNKTLIEV